MLSHDELTYADLKLFAPVTTLREAALLKVAENLVSLTEVNRVISHD
jgi:type II secretory ATPase GspE/PulE/Tfp pilus assembly ATPase PilB-like protein